jgi:Ca-activated chloride channel homolog
MKRVVQRGSLLIMAAIVSACAAQRDEHQARPSGQDEQATTTATPPAEHLPAARDPLARERSDATPSSGHLSQASAEVQRAVVTGNKAASPSAPVMYESREVSAVQQSIAPAAPCCPPHFLPPPAVDTERYQHLEDNPVRLAAEQPVSTFSIDVDTGAYANVRRFLNAGSLPPQDAVRIEEMINYFDYQYPSPANRDTPFRVSTELAPAPWSSQALLLRVGIKGFEVAASERPPANLVFLIDVSGSMQTADKLPLLKNAFRLLTDQLGARDRVAMIVYAGSSGVVLEPTAGDQKYKIREAIDRLEAGGSTNGAAGIERAYELARSMYGKDGINRVVLATDGDFNVGVVSFEALMDLAKRERASGIALTTLGFGTGNYNDQLLERLADAGNGNYAYVDNLSEARKVLVSELSATLFTIARDVKIQVEFNPAEVLEYRLIGYENRLLAREDFSNDKVDAGEVGAGHRVTALYEIVPVGARGRVEPLRYAPAQSVNARNGELAHLRLRYKKPDSQTSALLEYPIRKSALLASGSVSPDFRFAASVAAFGQLLRGGKYLGDFGYADIEALARGALDQDSEGYRREFISLVKLAQALAPQAVPERVSEVGR